jgi:hypothetical protein
MTLTKKINISDLTSNKLLPKETQLILSILNAIDRRN